MFLVTEDRSKIAAPRSPRPDSACRLSCAWGVLSNDDQKKKQSLGAAPVRRSVQVVLDGVVLRGTSEVDESMITGEPLPVLKAEHSTVTGGTINGTGVA